MRFAASLQIRMSERPGSPVLLQMHGARCRRRHCVWFFRNRQTYGSANAWTPRHERYAVAEARNILGGVNPPVQLPSAPQPFWLEGPLEPPFGRTFTPDCALQRACKPLIIHHSEYPIYESHSFLERVCCSTSSGQERLRGLSVLEKEQIIIFITRTYSTRPNTLLV